VALEGAAHVDGEDLVEDLGGVSGIFARSAPVPALLKAASSLPYSASMRANSASMLAVVMSQGT
jgi:hypothetical protein